MLAYEAISKKQRLSHVEGEMKKKKPGSGSPIVNNIDEAYDYQILLGQSTEIREELKELADEMHKMGIPGNISIRVALEGKQVKIKLNVPSTGGATALYFEGV